MADFYAAIDKILDVEGGYQDHPNDKGNYNAYDSFGNYVPYDDRPGTTLNAGTNRGISAALYSRLKGREVTAEEIKAITKAEAITIYKKYFWDTIKGDEIKSQRLAELIFDAKVNQYAAIRYLQAVLNKLGNSLAVDGKVGPLTLAAINKANVAQLYNNFLKARADLYRRIVEKNPSQSVFLKGWLKRLSKFPYMKQGATVGGIIGFLILLAILYNLAEE
jgi:lysozyme family protein